LASATTRARTVGATVQSPETENRHGQTATSASAATGATARASSRFRRSERSAGLCQPLQRFHQRNRRHLLRCAERAAGLRGHGGGQFGASGRRSVCPCGFPATGRRSPCHRAPPTERLLKKLSALDFHPRRSTSF